MVDRDPIHGVQRRVAGYHDVRMDGMHDLVLRCRGWSVLDVGCNRGMVGFELACNGARLVHGVDNDIHAIEVARSVFADIRSVQFRFEALDLSHEHATLHMKEKFGDGQYNLVLLLAIVHKLERVMSHDHLMGLLHWFGTHAENYVAGHIHEPQFAYTHEAMHKAGLRLIHRSYIADPVGLGPAFVWKRGYTGIEPV
jgi:SAM-dependent methyltransferase